MFSFKKNYFFLFVIVLMVELFIAVFVQDKFVRPYLGDFLAVILVYTFLKSFTTFSVYAAAIFSLLFAYFLEILQYFSIIKKLSLEDYKILTVVIGNYFEWSDMIAYTFGIATVIAAEAYFGRKNASSVK